MAKKGRPNIYETIIKPSIESGLLLELAKNPNYNKRKIAKALGVSYSAFMQCQKDYKEISDIFQKARISQVEELEQSAKKEATGYWITETKTTRRQDDGGKTVVVTEEYKKWCRPCPTLQIFLLSNWTHEKNYKGDIVYSRDPSLLELREKELELKEKLADKEW